MDSGRVSSSYLATRKRHLLVFSCLLVVAVVVSAFVAQRFVDTVSRPVVAPPSGASAPVLAEAYVASRQRGAVPEAAALAVSRAGGHVVKVTGGTLVFRDVDGDRRLDEAEEAVCVTGTVQLPTVTPGAC